MKPDGAIFDLDGTLTDSMYIWNQAPKALVRRFGGRPPDDLAQAIKEMGRREASEYMICTFRLNCTPEAMMQGVNDLVTQAYRTEVPMKPGADQLLARLAALGVPCAVATASEAYQAQDALTRLGLWKHVSFALSSVQYGPKTGPDIYLEAARRLGSAPDRTVVFEDALHAARAAKHGGFLVAGVYDASAEDDQAELKAISDWYLPSLDSPVFLSQLG
ncbi:MAG: HAD family phosphatase [Lawsonibacter sp.]|nr:HAD family phosphatase [Lawsonibacter sp.]